jgi:PKD repeat protein
VHAPVRRFLALSMSICGLAALVAPGAHGATGEVRAFGTSTYPAMADTEFYGAGPVAFDGSDLLVADLDPATNPRLRRYSSTGALEATTVLGSPDPYVVALAVDSARDRLYALTVANGDAGTAAQVLVFDTTPDCAVPGDPTTCTLVAPTGTPSLTDGVLIDFPSEPTAAVDFASGLAVDPNDGRVAVLGVDDASLANPSGVLQYVDPDGTPATRKTPFSAGLDPDGAGVANPSGLAIAPNGDAYVATGVSAAAAPLPYREPFSSESVFRLPGGTGTASLVLTDTSRPLAWPSAIALDPDTGGGRKGSGASLALSADGSTVYLGEGDASTARVRGFSTADGTLRTVYSSGPTTCRLNALSPVENHPTPNGFGIAAGTGDALAFVVADFAGEAQLPVVHLLGTGGSGCANLQGLFTVDESGAGPVTVVKGTAVRFDASMAQLLGGRPTRVAWDFDGSGAYATVQTGTPALAQATHTFVKTGTYQVGVRLQVDGGPTTDPVFHQVKVVAPTPTAAFTASTARPAPGAAVTFDASGSIDPAGTDAAGPSNDLATYRWDFGDGATQQTTTRTVSHAFANPAAAALGRTVTLTVVSRDGVTSEPARRALTVAGTPVPSPPGPPAPAPVVTLVVAPRPVFTVVGVDAKGTLSLKVTCPKGGAACTGKIALTAKDTKKKKVVKLATTTFSVPAGQSRTIKRRLSSAGWSLLRRQKRLTAGAAVTVTVAGRSTASKRTLTLRAPAKKKARKR